MKLSDFHSRWAVGLLAPIALTVMLATPVHAHDEEGAETPASSKAEDADATDDQDAEDPNTGALSLTFDNSFTTAYMFKGIMNERDGLIWQPSLELSLNVFESEDGVVESVDAENAILIPVFIAEGWHTRETIPEDLGLTGEVTVREGKTIYYGAPVGTHPSMANLIASRARETMTEEHVV